MELLISAVEPQKKKKGRFNIYTDGEYSVSLNAETCAVYNIKPGQTIDEDTLKAAVAKDNTQYAFDSAVSLLAHQMRTKSELTARLNQKGIDPDAVHAAIQKLAAYGYVDDDKYANDYVESAITAARLGRRAVAYRLKEKGIDDTTAQKALLQYTYETEKSIAAENMDMLRHKYRNDDAQKQRRKIFSALQRRGFEYEIINALLSGDDNL